MAAAKMRKIAKTQEDKYRGIRVKNGSNYHRRNQVRNHNKDLRELKNADKLVGMIVLNQRIDNLNINGLTPDGKQWLINNNTVEFIDIAENRKDILVDLLILVRPYLKNPTAFESAVSESYPFILEDFRIIESIKGSDHKNRTRPSKDYSWIADSLSAQQGKKKKILPFLRPLNNRVRHVR